MACVEHVKRLPVQNGCGKASFLLVCLRWCFLQLLSLFQHTPQTVCLIVVTGHINLSSSLLPNGADGSGGNAAAGYSKWWNPSGTWTPVCI